MQAVGIKAELTVCKNGPYQYVILAYGNLANVFYSWSYLVCGKFEFVLNAVMKINLIHFTFKTVDMQMHYSV